MRHIKETRNIKSIDGNCDGGKRRGLKAEYERYCEAYITAYEELKEYNREDFLLSIKTCYQVILCHVFFYIDLHH